MIKKLLAVLFFSVLLVGVKILINLDASWFTLKVILVLSFIASLKTTENKNYLLIMFLLLFSVFFVSTVVFTDLNDLRVDYLLKAMYLNDVQLKDLYFIVIVYMMSVTLFNITKQGSNIKIFNNLSSKELNEKWFFLDKVFIILFIIISIFYFNKINAILSQGYAAYHLGLIKVKKGIFFVIIELLFLYYLYYGLYKRKRKYILIFIVYSIYILATGMRMPFMINLLILIYVLYYSKIRNLSSKFIYISTYIFSVFVIPPFLLLTNRYRTLGKVNFNYLDSIQDSYNELFVILGITLDTLKGAIIISYDKIDVNVSVFARFTAMFQSVENKINGVGQLSMNQKLELGTFGSVVTNYFNSDLYKDGITIASSFLAESYLALGIFGVILSAFFHVSVSRILMSINIQKNFIGFLFFMVFSYWFLNSVRNDFLGWVPLALLYFIVYYMFHIFHYTKK